jgi:hypothetical protein
MNLELIEQTFEAKTPYWIFRFRVVGQAAMVSRVPADRPLWNHGVIRNVHDRDAGHFVIAIKAGTNVWFDSLDDAVQAAGQTVRAVDR